MYQDSLNNWGGVSLDTPLLFPFEIQVLVQPLQNKRTKHFHIKIKLFQQSGETALRVHS